MYTPYQFATTLQDDRLQAAENRRLGRAARAESARTALPRRSPRRDVVRAFWSRGAAPATH